MLNLMIHVKPHDSALGQPLQMVAHASNWGVSLNQCRRGGNRLTLVMMFVGGAVSVNDSVIGHGILVGNIAC